MLIFLKLSNFWGLASYIQVIWPILSPHLLDRRPRLLCVGNPGLGYWHRSKWLAGRSNDCRGWVALAHRPIRRIWHPLTGCFELLGWCWWIHWNQLLPILSSYNRIINHSSYYRIINDSSYRHRTIPSEGFDIHWQDVLYIRCFH